MIPYSSFYFFFILGVLLIPIIVFGYKEKRSMIYYSFVHCIILLLVFISDINQLISLVVYIFWQVLLVQWYASYRKEKNESDVFYLVTLLSIVPLFLTKILPVFGIKNLVGFLGISYLTFKTVQMIIDIRDGVLKTLTVKEQLAFLLFFPTISSGPIDRFKRFKKDMDAIPTKEEYRLLLYQGINKIFLGFLYKFIIAYMINERIIQTPFIQDHTPLANFLYMYAYSFYLFFDFAGYSAFAIGVSYIMGIKTPENFNLPFISKNIKDFWNRWHMSLSFWFRDYVYMRFVLFMTKKKWIKNRYAISYMGYFLLFLLMGLWHGMKLHYIAYGLYHALLIISFDYFERKNKQFKFWKKNKVTNIISIIITFHAVCFGFLIFSGRLF
jgi:membrane protein involved in D-alanine export